MTDSAIEDENGAETSAETLRDRGAQIAAMVDQNEADALAAEAAEATPESDGMPCPVCGGNIPLPDAPPQDSQKERCPTCHGFGMTVTGSLVPEMQIDSCSDCQGRGWVNKQPVFSPPVEAPRPGGETPQRVEVVSSDLPPLVIPDLSNVKVG